MKIVLISCTKKKQCYPCKAETMYSASALFRKELQYAKTLTQANNIFVLSAEYGLLKLDDTIVPYDYTLNGKSKPVITKWATKVFDQLKTTIDLSNAELVFLAGNNYRKQLIPLITSSFPNINIDIPTKGMGIGVQLKFYTETIKTH